MNKIAVIYWSGTGNTEEMANARDKNGELLYGESHILTNLFNIKVRAYY